MVAKIWPNMAEKRRENGLIWRVAREYERLEAHKF